MTSKEQKQRSVEYVHNAHINMNLNGEKGSV